MKKQNIINIALIACVITLGAFKFIKNEKTVYVEVGRLMQEYKGMKDARAEYEKKVAQWQANADTIIAQWENELKIYEKERSKMTKKERELKEELLRNKQTQISQYREAVEMKARDEDKALTQNVLNAVNDYVAEYGKHKGYKYILGANGSGNVIYAEESCDITDDVIEGLNKQYKKEHK